MADLAGKRARFVITIVAARRLPAEAFGMFALGSTLGWMLAVSSDVGIQLHLAREVARRPGEAPAVMRSWLRVRVSLTAAALCLAAIGLLAADGAARFAPPIAMLALVVNVVLNAQLIPVLSIDGTAWATPGTEAFLTCGCGVALVIVHGKARGMVGEAVAVS